MWVVILIICGIVFISYIKMRKGYTISKGSLDRYHCDYRIFFNKYATLRCLRSAISEAVQSDHSASNTTRIKFENFVRWNTITTSFAPFQFDTISFEEVNPSTFCPFDLLQLPCEELILPQGLSSINLYTEYIPHIHKIRITSRTFVSLKHPTPCHEPISVSGPIEIFVWNEVRHLYEADPAWSSLTFVDDEGNIYQPFQKRGA